MIQRLVLKNYRQFATFDMEFNPKLNIIVGDNECGKSTILEAINLAMTKKLNTRSVETELTPFLFTTESVQVYLKAIAAGAKPEPPSILIEVYFREDSGIPADYLGRNNSREEDTLGVKLEIAFNDEYADEYATLLTSGKLKSLPTEYYRVTWLTFADNPVPYRGLPAKPSYIDASTIRLQSGADYYLQDIVRNDLDAKERVELNIAYRNLKESFANEVAIKGINDRLAKTRGTITDKDLSVAIDVSQKASWESHLLPHLDGLPFHLFGKGEQATLKIMLALERKLESSSLVMIEEPENHLTYVRMHLLIARIQDKCKDRQILMTTHSSYVLNKLGLDSLHLLHGAKVSRMKALPDDTQDYFMKLSGYDTLRIVLAPKVILVEGPSDELVVQRAYIDLHGHLPIQDGIDVLSMGGLSVKRFLDIAVALEKPVRVVTDNDGDYANKITKRFKAYDQAFIRIHASREDSLPTLEPQMVEAAGLAPLNKILGTSYASKAELIAFMTSEKTECALRVFESTEKITMPPYVLAALHD